MRNCHVNERTSTPNQHYFLFVAHALGRGKYILFKIHTGILPSIAGLGQPRARRETQRRRNLLNAQITQTTQSKIEKGQAIKKEFV